MGSSRRPTTFHVHQEGSCDAAAEAVDCIWCNFELWNILIFGDVPAVRITGNPLMPDEGGQWIVQKWGIRGRCELLSRRCSHLNGEYVYYLVSRHVVTSGKQ